MKNALSIRAANVTLFITMALVLVVGSVIQMWSFTWGLIATEVVLIMLPALIALRINRVPVLQGLRLKSLGLLPVLLCLGMGAALYLLDFNIEMVMMRLTGTPSVTLPAGALPDSTLDFVLYFIALAVAAPICEEILFRGVFQGAYERNRPVVMALVVTAISFILYHFRVTGIPGLIPISFLLCYVVWRTGSLFAGILVHFANNGFSAAYTIYAINNPETQINFSSPWVTLGAALVILVLIFIFNRVVAAPNRQEEETQEVKRSWWGNYWPLVGSGVLYSLIAGLTLVVMLFPNLTAATELIYAAPTIHGPKTSVYEVTNRVGDKVGEMTCVLTPELSDQFSLHCESTIQAYIADTTTGYFQDGDHTRTFNAKWDGKSLDLLSYSFERRMKEGGGFQAALVDNQLVVRVAAGDEVESVDVAEKSLLEWEWAWRCNTLNTGAQANFQIPYVQMLTWNEAQQKSMPKASSELLQIKVAESMQLPFGQAETWKVTVGGQSAWYAREDQDYPRPVKFDDGALVYTLVK